MSASYRRQVAARLTRRALARAAERAQERSHVVTRHIKLTVNGTSYEREVEVRWHHGRLPASRARPTGTHLGCEHGVCGACTVLVDGDGAGVPDVRRAGRGREILTVEGLAGRMASSSPAAGFPGPITVCSAAFARPGC